MTISTMMMMMMTTTETIFMTEMTKKAILCTKHKPRQLLGFQWQARHFISQAAVNLNNTRTLCATMYPGTPVTIMTMPVLKISTTLQNTCNPWRSVTWYITSNNMNMKSKSSNDLLCTILSEFLWRHLSYINNYHKHLDCFTDSK